MTTLLSVENLSMRFGGVTAVDDVSFSVEEGQIASIIGPNGAGKTTFFNCLSGVYIPTSGRIVFSGEDITPIPDHAVTARGICRTFQNIRLFGAMTVLENVLVGGHVRSRAGVLGGLARGSAVRAEEHELRESARRHLAFVGLSGRMHETADDLPYGQKRRLEIARALAAGPRLVLLDEPAAGLNPTEADALMKLIGAIRDAGVTVIVIEHHMQVVMGISDRILVLDHGVRIAEGTPAEIRKDPRVIAAYLGREAV